MNFSELPFYEKLQLFIRLPDDKFIPTCLVDKEFAKICSGKLTPEIISKYGANITEELYEERVKYRYDEKFLEYKENMSWQEFYNELTDLYRIIDSGRDIQDYFFLFSLVNEPVALKLKLIQDIIKDKERNIVAIAVAAISSQKYDILKWVLNLDWDEEKMLNEIRGVLGNFNNIYEAILVDNMSDEVTDLVNSIRQDRQDRQAREKKN